MTNKKELQKCNYTEDIEVVAQIKLKKDKKEQVKKIVFGENNLEILNR